MNRNHPAATRIARGDRGRARPRAERHRAGRAGGARRNHGDRAQARRVAAGRSVRHQRAHRRATRRSSARPNIEDVSRNVAGLSVQNLGPGQSQVGLRGISAGKTDRDLAGREGAGRRVHGRVRDLAVAVHAGPRPLRPQPGRSAARPAGHAVRLRLAGRHGALHQQPAGPLRRLRRLRGRPQHDFRRRRRRLRPRHAERAARRSRGAARRRLLQRDAGLHRRPRPRRDASTRT